MESGVRESSGTVGSVLIPMRFVWPCGGRSVFMSGSFNRLGGFDCKAMYYLELNCNFLDA